MKSFTENDLHRQMDHAIQLIARAYNCVGCGLCAARCAKDGAGCLKMVDGKVTINGDDCVFCQKCYGSCPAVNFAPAAKTTEEGFDN